MPAVKQALCSNCGVAIRITNVRMDPDSEISVSTEPCPSCTAKAATSSLQTLPSWDTLWEPIMHDLAGPGPQSRRRYLPNRVWGSQTHLCGAHTSFFTVRSKASPTPNV